MSYDLYFYMKNGGATVKRGFIGSLMGSHSNKPTVLAEKELLSYLTSYGHFSGVKKTDNGFEAIYHNKDTEATATFAFNRRDAGREGNYQGYSYTGLSMKVDYIRPFYYGYEAAMVAEAICNRFGMSTSDPQSSEEAPKSRTMAEIFSSWDRRNTDSVRDMINRTKGDGGETVGSLPDVGSRMSRESSRAYWEYLYNHNKIARYIDDHNISAYLPTWIFVFQRNTDKKLLTAMPFMEGVNYVVPKCDLFEVTWENHSKSGIVKYETLLSQIRDKLHPLGMPGMDLQYLDKEGADQIRGILHSLDLEEQYSTNYKIIRQQSSFIPGIYIDTD